MNDFNNDVNNFAKKKLKEDIETSGFVLKKLKLPRLRIWLINDVSGSAHGYHDNGTTQKAFNVVYPIAIQVDDDGQLPTAIFASKDEWQIVEEPMNEENWEDYVKKHIMGIAYWGGTVYNQVLRGVLREEGFFKTKEEIETVIQETLEEEVNEDEKKDEIENEEVKKIGFFKKLFKRPNFFKKKKKDKKEKTEKGNEEMILDETPNQDKTAIYFFTDGASDDPSETETTLNEIKNANVFIMFVGIKNNSSNFSNLEKWAKKFQNVGFVELENITVDLEKKGIYDLLIPEKMGTWYNKK